MNTPQELFQAFCDGKQIEYENVDGEWVQAYAPPLAGLRDVPEKYRIKPKIHRLYLYPDREMGYGNPNGEQGQDFIEFTEAEINVPYEDQ